MLQSLPVYVISLKDAVERRSFMKAHLDTLGIEHEFIDAVRGDSLSEEYLQEVNPTRNMSPGQVGCYLSHISIYQRLIAENTPVALILEDDTVLDSGVKCLVMAGCRSHAFDYCFLGSDDAGDSGFVFYDSAKPTRLTDTHCAYPLSAGPFGTYSYLISLDGAKKRMSCAYPLRSAIDHYHPLTFTPRFMATIPMVTSMNELSALRSISALNWTGMQRFARRYSWYYTLRDILKLKTFKKLVAFQKTEFPWPGQWRPFKSASRVVARAPLADGRSC